MLRGYQPLKEIYRWLLVIATLVVPFAVLFEIVNGVSLSLLGSWFSSLLAIYLLTLILWPLTILPLRREQQKLFKARSAVLNGEEPLPVQAQPSTPAENLLPPFHIQTQLQHSALRQLIFSILLPISIIFLLQLPYAFSLPSFLPEEVQGFISVITLLLFISCIIPLNIARHIIAEYYLLPQLEVDDSGITAHYGPDVVHIAWQNIRYFALIDCKMIRRPSSQELPLLYEICDGENIINWYAQPLMKTRQTLQSNKEYARLLNEQLPALVSQRAELPLLDLRQPKRAESLV